MHKEGHIRYKNIGIYVRESRDDNEKNYETIETQRDLLIDFMKKNNMGKLYKIYIDNNVSGSAFERSALNQLKEDVTNGKIDLLLLKDLSRLGRNNARTLLFLDFLEEHGVRVITFDGRYDSIKDNETVGIETWFNERYLLDISKKIRANLRFKIQRGEYIGKPPFGYKKSAHEKNRLCIDENTAAIVREIFSLYLEGYGYAYIANYLNNKGYLSPAGRQGGWNAVAVQRILSNRVYIGDTVQGVSEKISYKSKKTRRLPASKWVITKNTHEALVDKDIFEEVQKIRKKKGEAVAGPHKGIIHLFRGLIFCGKCDSVMYARVRKNRPMGYICGNYCRNGKAYCTSHHVGEDIIKEILINELKELLNNEEIFDQAKLLLQESMEKESNIEDEIKYLEKQLQQKKRQQEILYMDRLEGKVTLEFFTRINEGLEKNIQNISYKLERLRNAISIKINVDSKVKQCIDNIIKEGISNKMARELIEKVTVYDMETDGHEIVSGLTGNDLIILPEEGKVIVVDFKFNKE
ncbi:MAG TPA: recombinase family protein [Clostridiaceae bacterium]|nr:recombinase family protein [Clostridiaceae bacterium]